LWVLKSCFFCPSLFSSLILYSSLHSPSSYCMSRSLHYSWVPPLCVITGHSFHPKCFSSTCLYHDMDVMLTGRCPGSLPSSASSR
jgi:hypothetical protein